MQDLIVVDDWLDGAECRRLVAVQRSGLFQGVPIARSSSYRPARFEPPGTSPVRPTAPRIGTIPTGTVVTWSVVPAGQSPILGPFSILEPEKVSCPLGRSRGGSISCRGLVWLV